MITIVAAATAQALSAPAALRAELGPSGASAGDARLERLVLQASWTLAALCGRPEGWGRATVRELFFPGRGGRPMRLLLGRDLSPGVERVEEDGVALDADAYLLEGLLLHRFNGFDGAPQRWTAGKVAVRYAAGFVLPGSAPPDLEAACLSLARAAFFADRDPSVRADRTEGVGETQYHPAAANPAETDPAVAAAVRAWRRVVVA